MRTIVGDLFGYAANYPYISPSTYICSVNIQTKQKRRELYGFLQGLGYKIKLVKITHNDKQITFNYMVFDRR